MVAKPEIVIRIEVSEKNKRFYHCNPRAYGSCKSDSPSGMDGFSLLSIMYKQSLMMNNFPFVSKKKNNKNVLIKCKECEPLFFLLSLKKS